MKKLFCWLLAIALIATIGHVAYRIAHRPQAAVRELTLATLRALPRTFLVLETQREVAVATVDDGGVLLGPRIGQATANRRTHYGIDVAMIGAEDVEVAGNRVLVALPNPTVFDSAIDPASVRMLSKRTGLQCLRDAATGRSIERELLDLLHEATPDCVGDDLRAQRDNFVERLNRQASGLFEAKGLDVRFR